MYQGVSEGLFAGKDVHDSHFYRILDTRFYHICFPVPKGDSYTSQNRPPCPPSEIKENQTSSTLRAIPYGLKGILTQGAIAPQAASEFRKIGPSMGPCSPALSLISRVSVVFCTLNDTLEIYIYFVSPLLSMVAMDPLMKSQMHSTLTYLE